MNDDVFELKEVLSPTVTCVPALVPILSFKVPSTTTSAVIQALHKLESETKRGKKSGTVKRTNGNSSIGLGVHTYDNNKEIMDDDNINKYHGAVESSVTHTGLYDTGTPCCEVDVFRDLRQWLMYLHRKEAEQKESIDNSISSEKKLTGPIMYSSERSKYMDEGQQFRWASVDDLPIIRNGCPTHLKRVRRVTVKGPHTTTSVSSTHNNFNNNDNGDKGSNSFNISDIYGHCEPFSSDGEAVNTNVNCGNDCLDIKSSSLQICDDDDFILLFSSSSFSDRDKNNEEGDSYYSYDSKKLSTDTVEILVDWLPLIILQNKGGPTLYSSHSTVKECIDNVAFLKILLTGLETSQKLPLQNHNGHEHGHDMTPGVGEGKNSDCNSNSGVDCHYRRQCLDVSLSIDAWVKVFWSRLMSVLVTSEHMNTLHHNTPLFGKKKMCKNVQHLSSSDANPNQFGNSRSNKDVLQGTHHYKHNNEDRRRDVPCLLGWKIRLVPSVSTSMIEHWGWLNDHVWPLATPRPSPTPVYLASSRSLQSHYQTSIPTSPSSPSSLVNALRRNNSNNNNNVSKKGNLIDPSNTAFTNAVRWIFDNVIDSDDDMNNREGMVNNTEEGENPHNNGAPETGDEFITMTAVVCKLPPDTTSVIGKRRITTTDTLYPPDSLSILAVVRRRVYKKSLLYLTSQSNVTVGNDDAETCRDVQDTREELSCCTKTTTATTDASVLAPSLAFPYGIEVSMSDDIMKCNANHNLVENDTPNQSTKPLLNCPLFPVTWLPPQTKSLTDNYAPYEHHVVFEVLTLANKLAWEKHNGATTHLHQTAPEQTTRDPPTVTTNMRKEQQEDSDDCSPIVIDHDVILTPDTDHSPIPTLTTTTRNDYYLCTDCDVVTNIEPCLMCSMGCVHSRVRRVIYRHRNIVHGGLSGGVENTPSYDIERPPLMGTSFSEVSAQLEPHSINKIERLYFEGNGSAKKEFSGCEVRDVCDGAVDHQYCRGTGSLRGIAQLHTIPSLNHHFRVFEVFKQNG